MKTKLRYILCLLLAVFAISCSREQEDLFNEGSSQRADKAMAEYLKVLTSAENGWLLDYYPSPTMEYGGYNILLKFNPSGEVEINGEFAAKPDTTFKSIYNVKQDAGITLSFNTYNTMFHIFSDPSDPLDVGGSGAGMLGDYDFLILNASAEKVLLKGKKTGNVMSMRPMGKGDSWSDYITKTQGVATAMLPISRLVLTIKKEYRVDVGVRNLFISIPDDKGEIRKEAIPVIVRSTGYELYKPYVLDGVTITGFTFEPKTMSFCVEGKPEYIMKPIIDPLNLTLVEGLWYIKYSTLGTYGKACWDVAIPKHKSIKETMTFAAIGTFHNCVGFHTASSDGAKTYYSDIIFKYDLIGDNEIKLIYSGLPEGTWGNNASWYIKNVGLDECYKPFVGTGTTGKTFTLSSDNKYVPTVITLTDKDDNTNVIQLTKTEVYNTWDK